MIMWGIIPAAGRGSRIQPLAFSKELLPVGSRDREGTRPCAVSEFLVQRMTLAGADKLCFVIAPEKCDILAYYADSYGAAQIAYVVQREPAGLCDAIFRSAFLIEASEPVLVGLPDTIWFPKAALGQLPDDELSFLLFPVERPELFDAVVLDGDAVREIQVKRVNAASHWIWGAFKMPGSVFHELYRLWEERQRADEYFGTLVNAYLAAGGRARGIKAGASYFDVGTLAGYRTAMSILDDHQNNDEEPADAALRHSDSSAPHSDQRQLEAGP
jgi:glucose-1-phosphate thymidylyltransferase